MPITTDLNVSPYFDDFNEDKNFLRILFRPGYAIQARELTQLQTILANQIEKLLSFIDSNCYGRTNILICSSFRCLR